MIGAINRRCWLVPPFRTSPNVTESPAINAGIAIPEWTVDLDQNVVADPPEIGPYEFE